MRFSHLVRCFVPLLLTGILACSSNRDARTAREFVQQYCKAWKSGDVETILAMRWRAKPVDPDSISGPIRAPHAASIADETLEVQRSVKRKDFSYTSWSNTEFVWEQEHDDHVHVSVLVAGAPSSIVLVRVEGVLKIHPNPSSVR